MASPQHRAWPARDSKLSKSPVKPSAGTPVVRVVTSTYGYDADPEADCPLGFEYQNGVITLQYRSRRTRRVSSRVIIASARLRLITALNCEDLVRELDELSRDDGLIGAALLEDPDLFAEDQQDALEWTGSLVIADVVVVDEYWRGANLGPRLAVYLARRMDPVAGMFLLATPLRTYVDAYGRCRATWEFPRPSQAMDKVQDAWRKLCFRNFDEDYEFGIYEVMALPWGELPLITSEALLAPVEEAAATARVEAWHRRRAKLAATGGLEPSLK